MRKVRHARGAMLLMAAIVLLSGCSLFSSNPNYSGRVQFGFGFHRISAHQIDIVKPRTIFYRGQTIAWVAYLKKRVGGTKVTMEIVKAGSQKVVFSRLLTHMNPKFYQLANSIRFAVLPAWHVYAPGRYTLRYVRGSLTLAEGTFQLRR